MNDKYLSSLSHLALDKDFSSHLTYIKTHPVSVSYYGSTYSSQTSGTKYCNCNFYEWSDVDSSPKRFTTVKEFFKFLDDSKITYNKYHRDLFDKYYTLFATCPKGKSTLVVANTYKDLLIGLNSINK